MGQYPAAVFLREDASRGLHKNTAYSIDIQRENELYKVRVIHANQPSEPLVYKNKIELLKDWDLVYENA
jgi:hypothetical protein